MTSHTDLTERLEKATGQDEHIDCLLWQLYNPDQRVMFDGGKAFGPGAKRPATYGRLADFPLANWDDWHAIRMLIDAPPVTASIDAALALVERVLPGSQKRVYDDMDGDGVGCDIVYGNGDVVRVRQMPTWPIAILIALLRATEPSNGGTA